MTLLIRNIRHKRAMGFPFRNGRQNAEIISLNDVFHLFKHCLPSSFVTTHPPLGG